MKLSVAKNQVLTDAIDYVRITLARTWDAVKKKIFSQTKEEKE